MEWIKIWRLGPLCTKQRLEGVEKLVEIKKKENQKFY